MKNVVGVLSLGVAVVAVAWSFGSGDGGRNVAAPARPVTLRASRAAETDDLCGAL
jgi:hypothetical protein